MTSLVEGLVAENNLEIFLNHKVTDISNESNHYLIKSNNITIKANHLVVTVPPACIKSISLKNVIPERLLAILKTLISQPMIQVHFKVKHPFWENDNYAPSLFSNELFGMCHEVRHLNNPEEIKGLTSWVMGEQAKKLLKFSPQEAAKIILNQYNLIRPSSKNNIEISTIAPWSHDENFQGGWVYFQPNGFKAFHEELKKLDSRFCLAGEYTAKAARGMEGAMESGEAAAEKIISQLY